MALVHKYTPANLTFSGADCGEESGQAEEEEEEEVAAAIAAAGPREDGT